MQVPQVLSETFDIIKSRFWPMVGLFLIYLVISFVLSFVFAGALMGAMGSLMGGMMSMDDPSSALGIGALGVGAILSIIAFYVLFLLVYCAQAVSLNAIASPWSNPGLADAFVTGIRSILTMLGILVLMIIAYVLGAVVLGLVIAGLGAISEVLAGIAAIALIPLGIYVGCRLALITAVVAMEGQRNPITAIARSWGVTSGHVLTIFLSFLGLMVLAIVFMVIVVGLTGGAASMGESAAIGSVLLLIPLMMIFGVVFSLAAATIQSVLLGGMSSAGGENLAEQFS